MPTLHLHQQMTAAWKTYKGTGSHQVTVDGIDLVNWVNDENEPRAPEFQKKFLAVLQEATRRSATDQEARTFLAAVQPLIDMLDSDTPFVKACKAAGPVSSATATAWKLYVTPLNADRANRTKVVTTADVLDVLGTVVEDLQSTNQNRLERAQHLLNAILAAGEPLLKTLIPQQKKNRTLSDPIRARRAEAFLNYVDAWVTKNEKQNAEALKKNTRDTEMKEEKQTLIANKKTKLEELTNTLPPLLKKKNDATESYNAIDSAYQIWATGYQLDITNRINDEKKWAGEFAVLENEFKRNAKKLEGLKKQQEEAQAPLLILKSPFEEEITTLEKRQVAIRLMLNNIDSQITDSKRTREQRDEENIRKFSALETPEKLRSTAEKDYTEAQQKQVALTEDIRLLTAEIVALPGDKEQLEARTNLYQNYKTLLKLDETVLRITSSGYEEFDKVLETLASRNLTQYVNPKKPEEGISYTNPRPNGGCYTLAEVAVKDQPGKKEYNWTIADTQKDRSTAAADMKETVGKATYTIDAGAVREMAFLQQLGVTPKDIFIRLKDVNGKLTGEVKSYEEILKANLAPDLKITTTPIAPIAGI